MRSGVTDQQEPSIYGNTTVTPVVAFVLGEERQVTCFLKPNISFANLKKNTTF